MFASFMTFWLMCRVFFYYYYYFSSFFFHCCLVCCYWWSAVIKTLYRLYLLLTVLCCIYVVASCCKSCKQTNHIHSHNNNNKKCSNWMSNKAFSDKFPVDGFFWKEHWMESKFSITFRNFILANQSNKSRINIRQQPAKHRHRFGFGLKFQHTHKHQHTVYLLQWVLQRQHFTKAQNFWVEKESESENEKWNKWLNIFWASKQKGNEYFIAEPNKI